MSGSQQYSLRWNNYFRHLTYALDNHRNNDDFVDVSLLCDGRKIKAHKVVLSACSSYFKEIFTENPHPHPIIIFKFIKFEDLNSIVEFMYQGEVNVQQEALQSFLQTAELLAVQGLTSDEKEKPKPLTTPIDEKIKSIPSTIRSVNNNSTEITQTNLEISPNNSSNMLQETTHHLQLSQQQLSQLPVQSHQQQAHLQIHPMQRSLLQQQQNSSSVNQNVHQVNVTIPHQTLQQIQQIDNNTAVQSATQTMHINTQTDINTQGLLTIPISHTNTLKRRKITFADNDDNIYTTDNTNYDIKSDPELVKASDVTLLRSAIPEYMISDDQLSEEDANTTTNANISNGVTQQYSTSEYEILTESEIDEKYNQQMVSDNNEITIEMGRLLTNSGSSAVVTTSSPSLSTKTKTNITSKHTVHNIIPSNVINNNSKNYDNSNVGSTTSKAESKTVLSDTPNNKWTECQSCKMLITTANLWRHIRTQHTHQPPRKCELCNKNFKNKYSLREHIRISHEQKLALKTEN